MMERRRVRVMRRLKNCLKLVSIFADTGKKGKGLT